MPGRFTNAASPAAHRSTTGPEIRWIRMAGRSFCGRRRHGGRRRRIPQGAEPRRPCGRGGAGGFARVFGRGMQKGRSRAAPPFFTHRFMPAAAYKVPARLSRISCRVMPSRYSLMTRFSPCQTGSVMQSPLRPHRMGSWSRQATGARLPSVMRRTRRPYIYPASAPAGSRPESRGSRSGCPIYSAWARSARGIFWRHSAARRCP